MIGRNTKSKEDISFMESLDTVNQDIRNPKRETVRVARIFKLSALFSKQVILSDTQFVDNTGIRNLFVEDLGFQDFLNETTLVGMRPKVLNFTKLVEQQLDNRMEFSSFDYLTQVKVKKGVIQDMDQLFNETSSLKFEYFIKGLDDVYLKSEKKRKIDFGSYPDLVENSLKEMLNELQHNDARKLCKELMYQAEKELESIETKEKVDRTIFYSVIDKSNYNQEAKEIAKRFFVDREYNKNFWDQNDFNCLTHSSERDTELFEMAFPKVVGEIDFKKRSENSKIIELPSYNLEGMLYLDEIDFQSLATLRHDYKKTIESYLDDIQKSEDPDSAYKNLRDYLNFLLPHINKCYEEKGLSKLIKKVNIGAVVPFIVGVSRIFPTKAFGIPYTTPGISFSIGTLATGSFFVLSIANLVAKRQETKQTKLYGEFEKCLREETHIY